jgi:hypothetical protein
MMKTKLLVLMFGLISAGCSSLSVPSEPVDIRGEDTLENGDLIQVKYSQYMGTSQSSSASGGGQRQSDSMAAKGSSTLQAMIRIMAMSDHQVTQFQIRDISGEERFRVTKPVRKSEVGKNPISSLVINAKKSGTSWIYTRVGGGHLTRAQRTELIKLEKQFVQRRSIFPEGKVAANHTWTLDGKVAMEFYESLGVAKNAGTDEFIKNSGSSPKFSLTFKGLRELNGESCAVVDFTALGRGSMSEQGLAMSFDLSAKGQIFRSLSSYRNLKVDHRMTASASGGGFKQGVSVRLKSSTSAGGSYSEAKVAPPGEAIVKPINPAEDK